ncbi:MAG: metal-dependent transcriptional regulator [Candidatus Eisenbacteria bacterium]|uniref:Metal-dependent transcriptional regulator n=1 Tax=Eiseniibacteriota bacterium TaxID=2212470 RepID=A0A849SVE3_UNCEI|nr:metal-dependent transcriptional regulator [Candidatus Eisenbacteria bacterium]
METWKRFGEQEVSHSMAHYLQAVATLKRGKGHARVGDIAEHLGVSKSGVTSMLRSLQARGLVAHERYGSVELTPSGELLADRTESSRRVLTLFLTEILGIAEPVANEDACMIEHLVSPEVSIELLRLTNFMRSEHPAVREFMAAYRETPSACNDHGARSCRSCGPTCLHESLVREVGEAGQHA